MNLLLLYLTHIYKGNYSSVIESLRKQNQIDQNKLIEIKQIYQQKEIKYLTPLDPYYPFAKEKDREYPALIFYIGNIELLNKQYKVAMINEIDSPLTKFFVSRVSKIFSDDFAWITSDIKKGQNLLKEKITSKHSNTIYILSSGLDKIDQSKINLENELYISVWPINTHPKKFHYLMNCDLIAYLADFIIMISSNKNSKSHGLVNYFLNYGKEVYCFPGVNIDDGNTQLIKDGASLITDIKEIKST
ncbi:DNA-processing protein DprA [Mycoplasmopsis glycophila]|nr:DNA-processing protein DprA [Mycoplasmopsis glycophila]